MPGYGCVVLCRGLVEVLQAARSAKERLQREVTAFEAQRDALLATHWEHMDANWTQQMQHLPLAQVRGDHRGRGEGGREGGRRQASVDMRHSEMAVDP